MEVIQGWAVNKTVYTVVRSVEGGGLEYVTDTDAGNCTGWSLDPDDTVNYLSRLGAIRTAEKLWKAGAGIRPVMITRSGQVKVIGAFRVRRVVPRRDKIPASVMAKFNNRHED